MSTFQLTLEMQADQDVIAREVPSQRVLELVVRPPRGTPGRPRPAMNLALVIDRSGSMSGEKLRYVKEAAIYVLEQLGEQDRVALVAFDNQVSMLSESVPVTRSSRERLKAAVLALETGATTNLSGGWLQGCQAVAQTAQTDQLNRTLLLTDGLANEGITDMEILGGHARELATRGVSTSTFGVGEGFNEHLLEHLANQGNGRFYYIRTPSEIPAIFLEELQELSTVTAQAVDITLNIPLHVDAQLLGGWRSEFTAGRLWISLGDIPSHQQRELYVKLLTPPQDRESTVAIQALAVARGPDGERYQAEAEVILRYVGQAEVRSAPVRRELMERFSGVEVAEAANEALKLERQGELDRASRMLNQSLAAAAPYLAPHQDATYRSLSARMRQGLTESDRKASHEAAYRDKQRRG